MVPPPFGVHTAKIGTNCKDLPNVDAVSCSAGKCIVESCKSGFAPSSAKDACAPISVRRSYVSVVLYFRLTILSLQTIVKRNNFINLKNLQKGGEGPGLIQIN